MANQNGINTDVSINADGMQMGGGVIKRILKWLGADITMVGSGTNTYTFPATTATLADASVVSANSAQMTSADNAISNAVSIVSAAQAVTSAAVTSVNQVVSALSNAVSVISAGLGGVQMKVVGGLQSISTSVAANISGLSISVAANGVYQVEARVIYNVSAISATGYRFAFVASGMTQQNVVGAWFGTSAMVVSTGGANIAMINQPFNGLSGAAFSVLSAGTAAVNYVDMEAIVAVSTTGGSLQITGLVNVGTTSMYVYRGSYIRAYRIL